MALENDKIKDLFSSKLNSFEPEVPASLWGGLDQLLSQQSLQAPADPSSTSSASTSSASGSSTTVATTSTVVKSAIVVVTVASAVVAGIILNSDDAEQPEEAPVENVIIMEDDTNDSLGSLVDTLPTDTTPLITDFIESVKAPEIEILIEDTISVIEIKDSVLVTPKEEKNKNDESFGIYGGTKVGDKKINKNKRKTQ